MLQRCKAVGFELKPVQALCLATKLKPTRPGDWECIVIIPIDKKKGKKKFRFLFVRISFFLVLLSNCQTKFCYNFFYYREKQATKKK